MAYSKPNHKFSKTNGAKLKIDSNEKNGLGFSSRLKPAPELESVHTGLKSAQAVLKELNRGHVSRRNIFALCNAAILMAKCILSLKADDA